MTKARSPHLFICIAMLSITACGGGGGGPANTAPATTPANTAPVAINDSYSGINQGDLLTVNMAQGVLSNDSDADNDTLSVSMASTPSNGNIIWGQNGAFTYQHDGSATSSDSFTYVANDGQASSNPSTVSITINSAPVATNDSYGGINQGDTLVVSIAQGVLSNDTDDNNDTLNVALPVVTNASNGTLTLNADGSFTYTHNGGASTTDSFSYRATDGDLESDIATVNLTINAAPSASLFCDNTAENVFFDGDLNTVVNDPDDTTFAFTQLTNPSNGTVASIDPSGTFRYTPNSGFRGTDSFTYMVDDLNGGTDTETVQIIVGNTHIMPLGDSITTGTSEVQGGANVNPTPGNRVGYRAPLLQALVDNNYAIDFVGSVEEGSSVGLTDDDLEGHPGIEIAEIENGRLNDPGNPDQNAFAGVQQALTDNPADIVLMHIGTNDFNNSNGLGRVSTIAADVDSLLDAIDVYETTSGNPVTVIFARIIGRRDGNNANNDIPNNVVTRMVNDAVVSNVQNRISVGGDNIIIVDMESTVTPAGTQTQVQDDDNGLHPTAAGYATMANVWLRPLTGTLGTATGAGSVIAGSTIMSNVGEFDGNALLNRCPL